MRKLLIAAVLATVAPAAAQAATPARADPTIDLNCAIWAANVSGNSEDPEISNGFGLIMTWFIGRWEGATGRNFEQGMTPTYIMAISPKMDQIGEQCLVRMQAFGNRMSVWGDSLKQTGQ